MTTFLSVMIMATVCTAIVEYDKRSKGRDFMDFTKRSGRGNLNAGAAC